MVIAPPTSLTRLCAGLGSAGIMAFVRELGDKQITWVDDLGDNSCSYPQFDLTPFQGMVFITSQLYPQIVKFGKCALVYCWFYHIIDEKAYSKV